MGLVWLWVGEIQFEFIVCQFVWIGQLYLFDQDCYFGICIVQVGDFGDLVQVVLVVFLWFVGDDVWWFFGQWCISFYIVDQVLVGVVYVSWCGIMLDVGID